MREARARPVCRVSPRPCSIGGRGRRSPRTACSRSAADDRVRVDTPFRIASISKPFTATLASATVGLDDDICAWLSATPPGSAASRAELLPEAAEASGRTRTRATGRPAKRVADAASLRSRRRCARTSLEPLGLAATGYDEPAAPARGHVQEGETGHRAVLVDAYPARAPAVGRALVDGRRSRPLRPRTTSTTLRRRCTSRGRARSARGTRSAGGCASSRTARVALDHEGSVGGLPVAAPARAGASELVLAVLTNSWRGSGLIRRVVEKLGLAARRRPRASPSSIRPSRGRMSSTASRRPSSPTTMRSS